MEESPVATDEPTAADCISVNVSRLGGTTESLQVQADCSLVDFKRKLCELGLMREGLAAEFILEGAPLNQDSAHATLSELKVVDGSNLIVITRRSHDYSQIKEVKCMVKSKRWPQGVLTTIHGHMYVVHFEGELQVYNLDLRLQREARLRDPVLHPSQMAMAPNGDLVMAGNKQGAQVAVVDAETLEVKRAFGATGAGKCNGLAMRGQEVFLSSSTSGSVAVLDFESGKLLRQLEGFVRPSGLCAFDGGLFVADRGADCVWRIDSDGSRTPIGQDVLKHPNDMAVDLSGNILVMDTGNARVAAFRPDGSLLCSILPGTFRDCGNTHSYISVNPVNGTICVSMDDIHNIAILAPAIHSE